MKKLAYLLMCLPLVLCILVISYFHIREAGFKDGYERGMKHYVAYHHCFKPPFTPWDELPSQTWRDAARHYVNDGPQDCAFVIAADSDASKKSAQ